MKHLTIIDGRFEKQDALDLIEKLIQVKTEFHRNKISKSTSEEDIKFREKRIKFIQDEYQKVREALESLPQVNLYAKVQIESTAA